MRWRPLQRSIYRSFLGRSEVIWSRREQSGGHAAERSGITLSGDYQFARRWFAGARFDRSDRADDAALHDTGQSLTLTFWPSEFSQIRGQYRRTRYADGVDGQRVPVSVPVFDRRARRTSVLNARGEESWTSRVVMARPCARRRCLLAASPAQAQGKLNVITTTEDLASIAREVGGDRIDGGSDRARLSGSAFRRSQAELHPEAAEGRSAGRRRPRSGDRLAAAAHSAEPQLRRFRSAPTGTSMPRCTRGFWTSRRARSPARWATSIRSATRTTGSIPRTARSIAQGDCRQARRSCGRPTARSSSSASTISSDASTRPRSVGSRSMAPYKGTKVVTYHRSFSNFADRFGLDVDRLRRAAAGHSAVAAAHARPDQRDEAAEREARARRAVLRSRRRRTRSAGRPARRCW